MKRSVAVLAVLLASALMAPEASALTTLKKVQVTDGSRIDLFFDEDVSSKQIRTEFFRDIVQLTIKGVSVYPAKITSVSGMDLTKVFAYQYTPKLVRTRLSVKGNAEAYKERVKVKADGKRVTVTIQDRGSDTIRHTAAAASATRSAPGGKSADVKIRGEKEQELFDKVMSEKTETPSERLTGGKPLPSPLKPFGVLGALLVVLAIVFTIVKKARQPSLNGHKGIRRMFSRLGISPKGRMIEVVSTHHLGPKKSIAMVKVAGRMLVLGVTNESINLISELPGSAQGTSDSESFHDSFDEKEIIGETSTSAPATGATAAGPSIFSDLLSTELVTESGKPAKNGTRQRIRSRLEGLKPL